jgi:hypothetical protein
MRMGRSARMAAVAIGSAVLLGLAGWAVAALAVSNGDRNACQDKVDASESKLRTERRWTDRDVPGIGNYRKVHWQVRVLGDPCSRAPGPTDYEYQGIVSLRPADAAALAENYDWEPVATAAANAPTDPEQASDLDGMPPALAEVVPVGVRWQFSSQYAEKVAGLAEAPRLYLDPEHSVAFFTLHTS